MIRFWTSKETVLELHLISHASSEVGKASTAAQAEQIHCHWDSFRGQMLH